MFVVSFVRGKYNKNNKNSQIFIRCFLFFLLFGHTAVFKPTFQIKKLSKITKKGKKTIDISVKLF